MTPTTTMVAQYLKTEAGSRGDALEPGNKEHSAGSDGQDQLSHPRCRVRGRRAVLDDDVAAERHDEFSEGLLITTAADLMTL